MSINNTHYWGVTFKSSEESDLICLTTTHSTSRFLMWSYKYSSVITSRLFHGHITFNLKKNYC